MIRDVIDATDESTILEHNLHVRHPDSLAQGYWGKGRVILVGDAAHPIRLASGIALPNDELMLVHVTHACTVHYV